MKLERTEEFEDALHKMESGKAFVFITGRAGTGKSTLLRHVVETGILKAPVLAPTGVAALNVEGETIHRFFKLPPSVDLQTARLEAVSRKKVDMYREIQAIIIDEISMVRADLLDAMDVFLQIVRKDKRPFGGLRVISIGDLYQLPPVLTTSDKGEFEQRYPTPYFFSSAVYQKLIHRGQVDFAELTTVYRQKDKKFIKLLNAIRDRDATEKQLAEVNARVTGTAPESAIVLTPTNDAANAINQEKLAAISAQTHIFEGRTEGTFHERDMATEASLSLKIGARVMCVANDPRNRYVNGSLGRITAINNADDGDVSVSVLIDGAEHPITIEPYTWNLSRSKYNKLTHELEQESVGSFTQIPLRLAWAVTIHKSQGKTFEHVTLDVGRGAFASGQIYVALSRCRTLEGIYLLKPITANQLKPNEHLTAFFHQLKNPSEIEYVDEEGQLTLYSF